MQHASHFLAQLLPQPINQYLFGLDLSYTHQHLIQNKHPLRKHSNPMRLLRQLKPHLRQSLRRQQIFRNTCFKLLNMFRKNARDTVQLLENVDWNNVQNRFYEFEQLTRVKFGD